MTASDRRGSSGALYVSITPATREFFKKCGKETRRKYEEKDDIEIDEVNELINVFNNRKENRKRKPVLMHEVLEGCQTTQRIPSVQPELSEVEQMRLRGAERKYQKSIEGAAPKPRSHEADMSDVSIASKTSAFAGHFIISFAGAFALGYYFVETFVDQDDFTLKAIVGGVSSFLTLIVESALFILYEEKQRIRRDKAAERGKGN